MKKSENIDIILFIAILFLVIISIIMISSVSVYQSYNLTLRLSSQDPINFPEPRTDFYLIRALRYILIGLPIWVATIKIPYSFWKKISIPLFIVSIILLLLVFSRLGVGYQGKTVRWLSIPYLPTIQPVEIAKLATILYLSIWLEKKSKYVKLFNEGFLPFFIILFIIAIPIIFQPDFGGLLTLLPVCIIIYFVAGAKISHLLLSFSIFSVFTFFIYNTVPYVRSRFDLFLNPELDILGAGWQTEQALRAIGNGGIFGVGISRSIQKFGYLPEVLGDTIFAAICEELGFIGAIIIIGLYITIAYRGFKIAQNAPNKFTSLVATGITSWIVWQAFINISVNVNLLPMTGITLPFISYGGTSLITFLIASGILLNISKYAKDNPYNINRRRLRGTRIS